MPDPSDSAVHVETGVVTVGPSLPRKGVSDDVLVGTGHERV